MSLYESHYGAHYGAHYEVQCMSLKLNVSFVRSIPLSHCKSHYKSHCKWKAIAESLYCSLPYTSSSLSLYEIGRYIPSSHRKESRDNLTYWNLRRTRRRRFYTQRTESRTFAQFGGFVEWQTIFFTFSQFLLKIC